MNRATPDPSSERVLLVKGTTGLGNRIFALLTAALYARLTRRRLLVDWSDPVYSPDGSNVFPLLFESPFDVPDLERLASRSVVPAAWRGHLDRTARSMKHEVDRSAFRPPATLAIDFRRDYEEEVAVAWGYFEEIDALRPRMRRTGSELRDKSTDEILRILLRETLAPSEVVRERVRAFRAEHFRQPTLGVHVRATDKQSRLDAIRRGIRRFRREAPEAQIFLATDNPRVEKAFREEYGRLVSTSKWFPEAGQPIHDSTACPAPLESVVSALVDMYLLAACDYLVGDESSSFVYVARLISDLPRSRVIDARRGRLLPRRLRHALWLCRRNATRVVQLGRRRAASYRRRLLGELEP